jgi:hypothetical protein
VIYNFANGHYFNTASSLKANSSYNSI